MHNKHPRCYPLSIVEMSSSKYTLNCILHVSILQYDQMASQWSGNMRSFDILSSNTSDDRSFRSRSCKTDSHYILILDDHFAMFIVAPYSLIFSWLESSLFHDLFDLPRHAQIVMSMSHQNSVSHKQLRQTFVETHQ